MVALFFRIHPLFLDERNLDRLRRRQLRLYFLPPLALLVFIRGGFLGTFRHGNTLLARYRSHESPERADRNKSLGPCTTHKDGVAIYCFSCLSWTYERGKARPASLFAPWPVPSAAAD